MSKPAGQRRVGREQGTAWHNVPVPEPMRAERAELGPGEITAYQRQVHDGHLTVFVDHEPTAEGPLRWHLSMSHRTNTAPPEPGRIPYWDELTGARDLFLPAEAEMVMCLPPRRAWINDHETCLHLWELPEAAQITGSRSAETWAGIRYACPLCGKRYRGEMERLGCTLGHDHGAVYAMRLLDSALQGRAVAIKVSD